MSHAYAPYTLSHSPHSHASNVLCGKHFQCRQSRKDGTQSGTLRQLLLVGGAIIIVLYIEAAGCVIQYVRQTAAVSDMCMLVHGAMGPGRQPYTMTGRLHSIYPYMD